MMCRCARRLRHHRAGALLLCVALAFPALTFASASAGGQDSAPEDAAPLHLAGYRAELTRLRAQVASLDDYRDTETLLRGLPSQWQVTHEAQTFVLPTRPLRDAFAGLIVLQKWQAQSEGRGRPAMTERERERLRELLAANVTPNGARETIAAGLSAMEAHAAALGEAIAGDRSAAEARLQEILSRREFASVRGPSWWDRLQERVSLWIDEVLRRLFSRVGSAGITGEMVFWGVLAVLFSVLALWVDRWLRRQGRPPMPAETRPAIAAKDWRGWAREALTAAQRADFREALHCAYWAGVFRLAEAGALHVDPARTPREYLRLLPVEHEQRPPLAALTRKFELAWYASRPATETDFREAATELEQLGCPLESSPATAAS